MKRNCLFILVDCLRADKCWGENRTSKTPTIDSLCSRGTTFTQTIAAATNTTTSVASILTGLYPFAHGIRPYYGKKLSSDVITLAEVFKRNGYHTYAEVEGPLVPQIGIGRDFDYYCFRNKSDNMYSPWYDNLLIKFKNKELKEPYFSFIHFFELHIPRLVAREYNSAKFGKSRYERALSSLDAGLKKLLDCIDNDTVIVLHADHGEKYGETIIERLFPEVETYYSKLRRKLRKTKDQLSHIGHGFHVYDYLLRVPLIFVGKDIFPRGERVMDQVRSVDIFPTLVEALGLKHENIKQIHGRSLLPLISGEELPEVPAYCEASKGLFGDRTRLLTGIRTAKYKYVCAPNADNIPAELYDLENDPKEKNNILTRRPDVVQELKQQLQKIRKEEMMTIEKRKIRKLKALSKI